MLGDIGGLIDCLLIICSFLIGKYVSHTYNSSLIHKVFTADILESDPKRFLTKQQRLDIVKKETKLERDFVKLLKAP